MFPRLKVLRIIAIMLFLGGDMLNSDNSVKSFGKTDLTRNSDKIKITIIYDNNLFNPELKNEWGFSCLIEGFEETILFDTGGDGEILLDNMKNLGIDPKNIHKLLISHDHWDHAGGLKPLLRENPALDIYVLPSFSNDTEDIVLEYGAHLFEIDSPQVLFPHVYTTGILGTIIREQSLVIETKNGLVIITGCAHPGIVNIVQHVKKILNQKIYMVFGGFHLAAASDSELKNIIAQFREMEVEKVGPCHCSGDRCRELFADEYKEDYLNIGVGKIIKIE